VCRRLPAHAPQRHAQVGALELLQSETIADVIAAVDAARRKARADKAGSTRRQPMLAKLGSQIRRCYVSPSERHDEETAAPEPSEEAKAATRPPDTRVDPTPESIHVVVASV